MKSIVKNSISKLVNTNRDYLNHEISRLGSVSQREASYRRNGMLNFGSRQLMRLNADSEVYVVGSGGPPIVG